MASLQELPDDELDKLFRASAEEFDPPYNPSDWVDLRQRLDQDSGRPFYYRLLFWGLPLLLLLITGVSVFYQQAKPVLPAVAETATSPVVNPATATKAQETADRPTDIPAPQGDQRADRSAFSSARGPVEPPGKETAAGSTAKNPGNVPRINESSTPVKEAIAANPSRPNVPANESIVRTTRKPTRSSIHQQTTNLSSIGRSKVVTPSVVRQPGVAASKRPTRKNFETSSTNLSSTEAGTSNPTALEQALNNPAAGVSRPRRRSRNGVAAEPSATIPNVPAYGPSETPSNASAGDRLLNSVDNRFDLTPDPAILAARFTKRRNLRLPTLQFDPAPELLSDADQLKAPVVSYPSHPSVSIRIVGAPDLNFVNRGHKPARSLGFGILGEYRFLERFTLQSGVLRSVKRYTVPFAEYPKPAHWYPPVMYESVGAECVVLDIPINLRFDVFMNDRRRWFISSGVSSYIMQKEIYTYNYPYSYKPIPVQYRQPWVTSTGLFKFSHLNLSFGYERRFRATGPLQRFSWQVEPFLKAPLRRVGWGNFRLTSAGAFFSVRYRL